MTIPLELFSALIGADARAEMLLEASLFGRGSGKAFTAAETSRKSCSSGAKILASDLLQ